MSDSVIITETDATTPEYYYIITWTFKNGRTITRHGTENDLNMIFEIKDDEIWEVPEGFTRYNFEHEQSEPLIVNSGDIESINSRKCKNYAFTG